MERPGRHNFLEENGNLKSCRSAFDGVESVLRRDDYEPISREEYHLSFFLLELADED
jgi:hypothetical protein